MICNACGANEATIHLTEIINNQMIEIHLCDACAREKGTDFKTHFNFSDLLAGALTPEDLVVPAEKKEILRCPGCGMTYQEFGKTGRLGCGTCYNAFQKMLIPMIKRVQRSTHHVGKRPSKITGTVRAAHDLRLLQDRLRKSVQMEAFEEAAQIRDQIKQLSEKLKKKKDAKDAKDAKESS